MYVKNTSGWCCICPLANYLPQEVTAWVRPSSRNTAKVEALAERGVKIIAAEVTAPVEELTIVLRDFDIVISAIDAVSMHLQRNLIVAAKQAGVKRFVPCAFISVCPPGGVLDMRDEVSYSHLGECMGFDSHLQYGY